MKKIYIPLIFLLFTATNALAQQEVLVIPYKIANPTENFTIDTGKEYAKLISMAAAIGKDITIYPHEKVYEALKELSLNSQDIITEDDLINIGKTGSAEYILIGTLTKIKSNYSSDSIFYSLGNKKIVSKSHASSGNFFKLAEEEMKDIFFNFPNKDSILADRQIDATILADLSYKVSTEWESIKNGIKDLADAVSENWNIDTEINIVPFSDKYAALNKYSALKSLLSVNEKLKLIKPAGTNSYKTFEKALSYCVRNIPWRRNSEKILIIISNSEKTEDKSFEQYALSAKMKKIAVYTMSLGLLKGDDTEPLRQFSVIASGQHFTVSYHQRFFDENGDPLDAFYQGGRIFNSQAYDDAWKSDLFEDNKKKFSIIEKPKSFLNEIFYDEKKYNINPYNLTKYYPAISRSNIINTEQIENNIESILKEIGNDFTGNFGKSKYKKPIAKAQISDGRISVWISIKEDREIDVFKKNLSGNSYFPLGAIIKKSPDDPYGIAFYPDSYVTEFDDEYIPKIIKTNLNSIIKNPDYYTSSGLFNPPVWFINVKVEKLENLKREYDIRDEQ